MLLHISRPLLYLDPGTGSLIVQLLAAGLLGIGVMVKIFWKNIKGLFVKDNGPQLQENSSEELNDGE